MQACRVLLGGDPAFTKWRCFFCSSFDVSPPSILMCTSSTCQTQYEVHLIMRDARHNAGSERRSI